MNPRFAFSIQEPLIKWRTGRQEGSGSDCARAFFLSKCSCFRWIMREGWYANASPNYRQPLPVLLLYDTREADVQCAGQGDTWHMQQSLGTSLLNKHQMVMSITNRLRFCNYSINRSKRRVALERAAVSFFFAWIPIWNTIIFNECDRPINSRTECLLSLVFLIFWSRKTHNMVSIVLSTTRCYCFDRAAPMTTKLTSWKLLVGRGANE